MPKKPSFYLYNPNSRYSLHPSLMRPLHIARQREGLFSLVPCDSTLLCSCDVWSVSYHKLRINSFKVSLFFKVYNHAFENNVLF